MAYRKKLSRAYEKLEASLDKLKESTTPEFEKVYRNDVLVEIVVKRFEYTFEGLWKSLKEIILSEGIECVTPLSTFKEAYNLKLIDENDQDVFPLMVRKRNEVVHIYSAEDAEEIFFLIKNTFLPAIEKLFKNIQKRA